MSTCSSRGAARAASLKWLVLVDTKGNFPRAWGGCLFSSDSYMKASLSRRKGRSIPPFQIQLDSFGNPLIQTCPYVQQHLLTSWVILFIIDKQNNQRYTTFPHLNSVVANFYLPADQSDSSVWRRTVSMCRAQQKSYGSRTAIYIKPSTGPSWPRTRSSLGKDHHTTPPSCVWWSSLFFLCRSSRLSSRGGLCIHRVIWSGRILWHGRLGDWSGGSMLCSINTLIL